LERGGFQKGEKGFNPMRFNKPTPYTPLLIINVLPRDRDLKHSPLEREKWVTMLPVVVYSLELFQ